MEQFKIDKFEREHGERTFPLFRELSAQECNEVQRRLRASLGLDGETQALTMLRVLEQLGETLNGLNAEDEGFELTSLFERFELDLQGQILINWNRFDRIDEISTSHLCKHFSDIWYPSSDDLELFDSELKWVLRFAHHGAISLVPLQRLNLAKHNDEQ